MQEKLDPEAINKIYVNSNNFNFQKRKEDFQIFDNEYSIDFEKKKKNITIKFYIDKDFKEYCFKV